MTNELKSERAELIVLDFEDSDLLTSMNLEPGEYVITDPQIDVLYVYVCSGEMSLERARELVNED
jgi:hypothetical protein